MEVSRQYSLKKSRLTPKNLHRSITGAVARAKDGDVMVMVCTPKGVKVPRKIETMWRSRKYGCGFELEQVDAHKDGMLTGWATVKPLKVDEDGSFSRECFTVFLNAMHECIVSFVEEVGPPETKVNPYKPVPKPTEKFFQ